MTSNLDTLNTGGAFEFAFPCASEGDQRRVAPRIQEGQELDTRLDFNLDHSGEDVRGLGLIRVDQVDDGRVSALVQEPVVCLATLLVANLDSADIAVIWAGVPGVEP